MPPPSRIAIPEEPLSRSPVVSGRFQDRADERAFERPVHVPVLAYFRGTADRGLLRRVVHETETGTTLDVSRADPGVERGLGDFRVLRGDPDRDPVLEVPLDLLAKLRGQRRGTGHAFIVDRDQPRVGDSSFV